MTPGVALGIAAAGWLAGLDTTSGPQVMVSRPLIAGLLGGLVAGSPLSGLAVGALLELYALDTLPVGATRAPDWGPGSVAAGALVALHQRTLAAPGLLGLVFVAVGSAWLGGWLSHLVRRSNGSEVRRHLELVDRGDAAALATIQRQGLFLDGARALGLTALAYVAGEVLLALVLAHWRLPTSVALVALVATSAAVALHAGWRVTGRGAAAWLAGGLILGAAVALWPR